MLFLPCTARETPQETNPFPPGNKIIIEIVDTRINSAGALLAFRKRFEAFPQYIRRPSVTRTSSR